MKKDTKRVKCSKCHRLLCKRLPVHIGDDESYIVQVQHHKMVLYFYDGTIICPICGSGFRINGQDGILERDIVKYDD